MLIFINRLTIKTSTWVRDSHELFDYETPHLIKKTIKIANNGIRLFITTLVTLEREEGCTDISEVDHKDEHTMVKKGQEIASVSRYSRAQICSFSLFDQEHEHPMNKRRY